MLRRIYIETTGTSAHIIEGLNLKEPLTENLFKDNLYSSNPLIEFKFKDGKSTMINKAQIISIKYE